MPAQIGFECLLGTPEENARRKASHQRRILIMGDLRGRATQATASSNLRGRSLVKVDSDTLDEVIQAYAPSISLPTGADAAETLAIRSLEDFHPDHLFQTLAVFEELKSLRRRLQHPASFAEAAAQLAPTPAKATKTPASSAETTAFQQLLGDRPAGLEATTAQTPMVLSQFIQEIVAPHLAQGDLSQQDHYLAVVDQSIAELMRFFLHCPDFQAIESTWLSIYWLLSQMEDEDALQVFLLDVSKEELQGDFDTATSLQDSALYSLLPAQAADDPPWMLLTGAYTFTSEATDLNLLKGLGAVASHVGGPFIAAAHPTLLGCQSLAKAADPSAWQTTAAAQAAWHELRRNPAAKWIGLAWPRMLLRLPYGKRTDPVDDFDFEEQFPGRSHEAYLWGNPAFACVALLCQQILLQSTASLEIDDLPAHSYSEDGESAMQACAEAYLGEQAAQSILQHGIMPMISYRNRAAVRVFDLRSIADPPTRLV